MQVHAAHLSVVMRASNFVAPRVTLHVVLVAVDKIAAGVVADGVLFADDGVADGMADMRSACGVASAQKLTSTKRATMRPHRCSWLCEPVTLLETESLERVL